MKAIFSTWFSSTRGCSGIIVTENKEGKRVARGGHVDGINQDFDIKHLRDYGGKVSIPDLEKIIELVKG